MNGVTDGYAEWVHADDCPFCGHPTHRVGKSLRCDNCEVTWNTRAEFETDRHGYDPTDDDRDRNHDSKWGLFR